jgi:hypothetical protein
MTGQVSLEGFPTVHPYSLSNVCINYIIYAVYRSNITSQVQKNFCSLSWYSNNLKQHEIKNGPLPALTLTVHVSDIQHTAYI